MLGSPPMDRLSAVASHLGATWRVSQCGTSQTSCDATFVCEPRTARLLDTAAVVRAAVRRAPCGELPSCRPPSTSRQQLPDALWRPAKLLAITRQPTAGMIPHRG